MVGRRLSSCWENFRTIFTRRHLTGMQIARRYHHICIWILAFYQRLRTHLVLNVSHTFSSVKATYLPYSTFTSRSLLNRKIFAPFLPIECRWLSQRVKFQVGGQALCGRSLFWSALNMHYKNIPKAKIHTGFHWCMLNWTHSLSSEESKICFVLIRSALNQSTYCPFACFWDMNQKQRKHW